MAKKVKLFLAPHLEVRIHMSDEMIRDYRECAAGAEVLGEEKDCNTCSWRDVVIKETGMCELIQGAMCKNAECPYYLEGKECPAAQGCGGRMD